MPIMYFLILAAIAAFVLTVKIYQKLTCAICHSSNHMVGKVVIVTGANCGIGLETAKNLAERGARVILACRNSRRAAAAKEEIVNFSGNSDVHFVPLDLASLRSVREFSDHILKTENRIDVLINNAGAGGIGNYKTEDGLHVGMQVNYFGPFLLTCLLLPKLKFSAPSRIINLSSVMHKYGEMDFDNLNMEKYWSDYLVYANSKLYINLMTLELAERLKGTGVTVNAVHPGVAATNLFRNIPIASVRTVVEKAIGFMFQSAWEASQTVQYLAVSPEVSGVTGRYFSDCREKTPSRMSLDSNIAKKLWTRSAKLVNYKDSN